MCVPANHLNVKELTKEDKSQLSSMVINYIQAKQVKDGMFMIHSQSGYCGKVEKLKKVSDGKHGHCKVIYELRLLHNGLTKKEAFKGKKIVKQAIINKQDYLVSFYDDQSKQVVCYNDDFEEIYLSIDDKSNKKVFDKLLKCIDSSIEDGKDCYVVTMEIPMVSIKNDQNVELLQIICDVKIIDPN